MEMPDTNELIEFVKNALWTSDEAPECIQVTMFGIRADDNGTLTPIELDGGMYPNKISAEQAQALAGETAEGIATLEALLRMQESNRKREAVLSFTGGRVQEVGPPAPGDIFIGGVVSTNRVVVDSVLMCAAVVATTPHKEARGLGSLIASLWTKHHPAGIVPGVLVHT